MPMDAGLFSCSDPAVWGGVHEKYWAVVEAKSSGKGKAGKLLALDKWYQEELPKQITARTQRHVTRDELSKLMEWKLTRGKFRPRLQQLIGSNSEEVVQSCSIKAFGLLPDVQAAILELSTLKGMGPATASAVLAAGAGEEVAFMADESVESIPELRPVQYTAKHYSLYLDKITQKTKTLNTVDSQQDWTPHMVELCLWTWAVASKLQPSLLEEFNDLKHQTNQEPVKRPAANDRAAKRQKT
ncbi:uncharacterized protein zgc:112496 [Alosa sapidissima]|uniref:uncharacterized protein zgc:112496 n=1 Tax=Alosa sapidissima TaxID=34773 RepID=UPI001C07F57D|nr:uncharacterized protein zgc:112496 [Alosa sapidissima]